MRKPNTSKRARSIVVGHGLQTKNQNSYKGLLTYAGKLTIETDHLVVVAHDGTVLLEAKKKK
jgi:hypothetical protein